jgi:hypothetical protein
MISIAFFFYKKYFFSEKIDEKITLLPAVNNEEKIKKDNNLIKKLKYKVQLSKNGQYEINAKSSEISYVNNAEIVSMNEVTAMFVDNENRKITIRSDKAKFNTLTYDTNFLGNIQIIYFKNFITAEKLDFKYKSDDIIIYENVTYNGTYGAIKADNVKINLLTKNIKISMDNPKNKVKIISN